MPKLLIIEDSVMMQKAIMHVAKTELDCRFDIVSTLAEAHQFVTDNDYYLALADLNLPDAPNGEIVDLLLKSAIPTIVLTATLNEQKRNLMLRKGVLDYIYKENRDSYYQAVKFANQILHNRDIKVLLADDSLTLRSHIRKQLQKLLFQVIEVSNGVEALAALEKYPEIELLITDYNMPEMDGMELIRNVRKTRKRDNFPIIGLSSSSDPTLSAKFIKHGANDFLVTPFIHEEFQWRILKTMEQIKLIKEITDSANRDYLTKLYNRRYFFNHAKYLHKQASANGSSLVVALMDIDFFKKINDNYGHNSGDAILIQLSAVMKSSFGNFTVARYGGEEFIVIIEQIEAQKCATLFELFRKKIAAYNFIIPDGEISVTVSIGAAALADESLERLISNADIALYEAKEAGRNKTIFARPPVLVTG
ncbi:MAG: hypothetical protein OFPII_05180 [Osedax symbiont Rs1]|nr:MAG: hypothetical protein OFPII_05180 [Osedax symbiont Rs1]